MARYSQTKRKSFQQGLYIPSSRISNFNEISKVINVLFIRALNEKLSHRSKSPLIVNYVNPGFCYSSLARDFSGLQKYATWLMKKFIARTTEEGGRLIASAALGSGKNGNIDELRGAYMNLAEVNEESDYVLSDEGKSAQSRLWVCCLFFLTQC